MKVQNGCININAMCTLICTIHFAIIQRFSFYNLFNMILM